MTTLLLALTAAHAQAWWDPAWAGRSRLAFDNAASATDVIDLPVLVVLRDGVNFDHTLASGAGEDLRFVDEDGATLLSYEIERWNDAGTSWLWVRVPRIDAGSATDHVWLYYDNPTAPAAGAAGPSTWEPSFTAVYHLDGPADATASGLTSTNAGTTTWPAAPIGRGRDFAGVDSWLTVPDEQPFDYTSALTVSFWAHVDAWVHLDWDALVTKGDQSWRVHRCGGGRSLALTLDLEDGGIHTLCGAAPFDDGLQHYVVATWDGAEMSLWIDGLLSAQEPEAGLLDTTNDEVWIGNNSDHDDRGLDGQLDEVRIASVGRTADWVAADTRSVADTLVTWCSRWGGDADADGVCDADDLCPAADDLLDADADGMADCLEVPIDSGTPPGPTGDTGTPTTPPSTDDTDTPPGTEPPTRPGRPTAAIPEDAGCDCGAAPSGPSPAFLLLALPLLRRRPVR